MNKTIKYILLLSLLCIGCKKEGNSYVVKDRFNNEHKYDRPPTKDTMVIYCQLHYEWETIRHYYTDEGVKYWKQTLKYFK